LPEERHEREDVLNSWQLCHHKKIIMNRVFAIQDGFTVPDGTTVYPFLNPKYSTSGLSWDLIEGFSMAAGAIAPHSKSKIQNLPFADQVTFVIRGTLEMCIKGEESPAPYKLRLAAEQAAVTQRGTFFQLENATDILCMVLYIVSPPYVFDKVDGQILYDDAVVLDEDWQALAKLNWAPPAISSRQTMAEARQAALDRLARRSG
jgi:hypothetical protein